MRRSNDGLILSLNGVPVALNFGADHVAEHEWGIKDTYRAFGIDTNKIGRDPIGIVGRTVQKTNTRLMIGDFTMKPAKKAKTSHDRIGFVGTLLVLNKYTWDQDRELDPTSLRELADYSGYVRKMDEKGRVRRTDEIDSMPLSTAWSDGDFAVFARKPEEIEFLKDLYEAFQNNDVAIWLGKTMPDNPFENAGLVLGIVSRMPAEIIEGFAKADQERLDLEAMDEATGIKKRLEAAGEPKDGEVQSYRWTRPFSYYALSPRAIDQEQQTARGTIHPVIYWLNPQDQDNVNFGWFTVEELDQWIAGTGPVPGGRSAKKSA